MIKKAIYCSDRTCGAQYHQMVNPVLPLVVDVCPRCGKPGVMIVGKDDYYMQTPTAGVAGTHLTNCFLVEKALAGSGDHIKLLRASFINRGYVLAGFHGCGHKSACAMMRTGVDPAKNTVGARGRGFYIGSLHSGIPRGWSLKAQGKGHGAATILAVYIRSFNSLVCGRDYDWGLMDEDDDVRDEGLEMVIRSAAIPFIRVLPALPVPAVPAIWANCPHDNFSHSERVKLRLAAGRLQITYSELVRKLQAEQLSENDFKILAECGLE